MSHCRYSVERCTPISSAITDRGTPAVHAATTAARNTRVKFLASCEQRLDSTERYRPSAVHERAVD